MFKSLISELLNRVLGTYIENLDPSKLNVSIWGGDVELTGLEIKQSALDELNLPVRPVFGYIGKLTLKIPWKDLYNASWVARVEEVTVVAVPNTSVTYNQEREDNMHQDAKMAALLGAEEARKKHQGDMGDQSKPKDGFVEKLMAQVIRNIQIYIRDIHIRYEDSVSCPTSHFAAGVTLHNLSIISTDKDWTPCLDKSQLVYKLSNLDSLGVYWLPDAPLLTRSSHTKKEMLTCLIQQIASKQHTPQGMKYKFHWGRQQVLTLISKVEEFFEDFYDGTKKKKAVWQAVSQRMQEEGFYCSGSDCDKKWRNLKGTYVKVLQKQIHGETSYRFEYFEALHHILGKEIDPLGMREQALTNGESAAPKDTRVPTKYNEITVDGEMVWSEAASRQLLDLLLHHHHHPVITSSPGTLHSVWQDMAQEMAEAGYEADNEQCQRKWVNLQEGFHYHQARAEATATVPLWAFFTQVRDLLNSSNIPTTVVRGVRRGRGRTGSKAKVGDSSVLGRVQRLEAGAGVWQRLDRLEARVEISCRHQVYKRTNTILTQILSELRRINTIIEQEGEQMNHQQQESIKRHPIQRTEHLEHHDESSCGSTQGIIIVEAYADQLL